jgi:hypothetical protein
MELSLSTHNPREIQGVKSQFAVSQVSKSGHVISRVIKMTLGTAPWVGLTRRKQQYVQVYRS